MYSLPSAEATESHRNARALKSISRVVDSATSAPSVLHWSCPSRDAVIHRSRLASTSAMRCNTDGCSTSPDRRRIGLSKIQRSTVLTLRVTPEEQESLRRAAEERHM